MRTSAQGVTALFAAGALASSNAMQLAEKNGQFHCMKLDDAKLVANNFKDLINLDFNKTLAREALAKDFHDFSDGVNELINAGCPGPNTLGQATFKSQDDFIKGQSTQPPIPFEILNLWHTCDSVHMRWRSSAPGNVKPELLVTGIVAIETEPNDDTSSEQPWLMKTVYSEFNSGAWLSDLGNFTAMCTADGLPKKPNNMMKVHDACADVTTSSAAAQAT